MDKPDSPVDTPVDLSHSTTGAKSESDLSRIHSQKSDFECKVYLEEDRKTIGEFLILREIGRGGMGVVYEAIQRSLSRRVALKVLNEGISDSPLQLQRFRREAESAAMLHHTNIVGVFGIGEENGVHYYAMQYIDGIPLGDAIATMRNRSTARLPPQAGRSQSEPILSGTSERVDAATPSSVHSAFNVDAPTVLMEIELDSDSSQNGPRSRFEPLPAQPELSEPLISMTERTPPVSLLTQDPIPETIASFSQKASKDSIDSCFGVFESNQTKEYFLRVAGLAAQVADALEYAHQERVLHRDIKPSNLMIDRKGTVWIMDFGLVKSFEKKDLTKVGEIVGTLRYMAPEQLEGKANVTTDIYALGVTLFELLTLRPAFNADEAETLSQRLRQSDIPKPRSINPAIPRDLETIVLKATSREPFARYRSAGLMADDLRRFCQDMPILARRTTPIERFWRWSRRNPALSIASLSIVLLLGMIAGVASIGWLSVNEAFREAEVARRRAESNLDSAINAFDTILENVTSREGPRALPAGEGDDSPEKNLLDSSEDDVRLLNGLLAFYRKFTSENADNNLLRERTSEAHRTAAAILVRLGRLAEAEEDYGAAVVSLFRVMRNEPDNSSVVIMSAAIHNDLGEVQVRRGHVRQTFLSHLEAIALLTDLPLSLRSLASVQFEMARARAMLASIDIRGGGDTGPEMTPFPQRISLRLKAAIPSEFTTAKTIADGATVVLRESSEQFHSLVAQFPLNEEYLFRFAQCQRLRGIVAKGVDDHQSARILFQDGLKSLEALLKVNAKEPKFVLERAETLIDLSTIEQDPQALGMLDRADADGRRLAKLFPAASDYPLLIDLALAKRAVIQAKSGSVLKAEKTLQRAITGLQRLVEKFPDQGVIEIPLAMTQRQLAELIASSTPYDEPNRKPLMRCLDILEPAIKDFERYLNKIQVESSTLPQEDFNLRTRSKLYLSMATILQRLELTKEENDARRKAAESYYQNSP